MSIFPFCFVSVFMCKLQPKLRPTNFVAPRTERLASHGPKDALGTCRSRAHPPNIYTFAYQVLRHWVNDEPNTSLTALATMRFLRGVGYGDWLSQGLVLPTPPRPVSSYVTSTLPLTGLYGWITILTQDMASVYNSYCLIGALPLNGNQCTSQ